jgi:hypothetical protein
MAVIGDGLLVDRENQPRRRSRSRWSANSTPCGGCHHEMTNTLGREMKMNSGEKTK